MAAGGKQQALLGLEPALPDGFVYQPEFLAREEETALLAIIATLPLEEATYKECTARRRTVSYGFEYDFARNKADRAPDIPPVLMPLREKVARWVGLAP